MALMLQWNNYFLREKSMPTFLSPYFFGPREV
jgi:hypothetical protein